jgi:hypothetical protein
MNAALTRAVMAICLIMSIGHVANAAVSGSTIAVIQGANGFKVALNNVGTADFVECDAERLICSNSFHICTLTGQIGTLGNVTFGLKRALVGDAFKHGRPFTTSLAGGNGTATYLTSVSIDAETGAPLYNAPAGKTVFVVLDQMPELGACLGVETFWAIDASNCEVCPKRKVYTQCCEPTTIIGYKEFFEVCSDSAIFAVNDHVAQAEVTTETDICHAFLSIQPGLSQSKLSSGSVAVGQDFLTEFNACFLTGAFSSAQEVGARWLELSVDLRPGGSTLRKCGGIGGFERVFGVCLRLACRNRPPGSGCPPGCVPE